MCKLSQSIAQHVIHVQSHNVKYSNCNNSASDCSISLKFGTVFDQDIAGTLQMFKVKGQRSRLRGQSSRSQRNVTYQQQKRPKTATDRLSDFRLGTGDEIKADRDCAASGCRKLQCTIATFSSSLLVCCQKRTNFTSCGVTG